MKSITLQIEIGTLEQYQKITHFLNRLKDKFVKKDDLPISDSFDREAYLRQISQVSIWTDEDITKIEQSSKNFNWNAPEW